MDKSHAAGAGGLALFVLPGLRRDAALAEGNGPLSVEADYLGEGEDTPTNAVYHRLMLRNDTDTTITCPICGSDIYPGRYTILEKKA